jgi:acyl-coenzyme A synthetase/AMP-(fatty) acid ligase
MQSALAIKKGDSILQKTPFSFDVSVREFLWPLGFGADLLIPKPGGHRDPTYLADIVRENRVSVIHFVPSMLHAFLDEPDLAEKCESLRMVICSGEALSEDLQKKFFANLNAELHNLYGPTEAAIEVTYWQCRADCEGVAVPIGYPIANTQLYILDANLEHVPVGVDGELYIGGTPVGPGYWRRSDLTDSVFVPDPFSANPSAKMYKTGDLARWRHDGAIEYRGRIDFQVKIRGLRIELGEIENALAEIPGINAAVASVFEPGPGDVRLVAYVVEEPPQSVADDEIRQSLERELPVHMVPQHFVRLDELPLTPNGKLDRKALPTPELQSAATGVSPSTDTEERMAAIWRDILRVDDVYRDTNFFAVGGHSLLAIRVLGRVRDELGIELPLVSVFDKPTLRALSGEIDKLAGAHEAPQTASRKKIRI